MEQLQKCLDELKEKDFKRFKSFLRRSGSDGWTPIPERNIEKADVTELVNVMIDRYSSQRAVEVTLNILRRMDHHDLVLELEKEVNSSVGDTDGPKSLICIPSSDTHGTSYSNPEEFLTMVQQKVRDSLKEKYDCIYEGNATPENWSQVNKIFTELYITEGESGPISNEHEVRKIETAPARSQDSQETPMSYNDIFLSINGKRIRTVLMTGIGGSGKTICVQKFAMDWADGVANQDIDLVFLLPLRELCELKGGKQYSLSSLVHDFYHQVSDDYDLKCALQKKVLFIFDGLDESSYPLDFKDNERLVDIDTPSSVDVLLTNLIKGNLLPSALVWITSRPAAASKIPPKCIHKVVEIRGFNDQQKEDYFRKKFSHNEIIANRVISHVKSSRSLYIMCHIPIFCWITATVLDEVKAEEEIPTTLTQMYTEFLQIQTRFSSEDCYEPEEQGQSDFHKDMFFSLGKLAFQQLQKGKFLFHKKDLSDCGIDVNKMPEYSGVCTEMFQGKLSSKKKVYCFIHLSIQEYFAALYVFLSYQNNGTNQLAPAEKTHTLSDLHKCAVNQAMKSQNGHLDLFLRFLLGLSATDPAQTFLESLLTETEVDLESTAETKDFIKRQIRRVSSPERCIALFHCLNELNDNSLVEEIKGCMSSGSLAGGKLSPEQLSALAYVWLMSDKLIDTFDLKQYYDSRGGHKRLLPVIKNTKKALLDQCLLTEKSCAVVASALTNSPLTELDLSYNDLGDAGVALLCVQLRDPRCRLLSLRLDQCKLTEKCCEQLTSIFRPNLKALSLNKNALGDSGVKKLCEGLRVCHLEEIRLRECDLTEECCKDLACLLRSPNSKLTDLDLTDNDLEDTGVSLLSAGLEDPNCVLQRLVLSGCRVTEAGCASLASALRSNPSHLRELDLSYNHPGDAGVRALEDSICKPERLITDHIGEHRNKPKLLKYACQLTLDPNTAHSQLALSDQYKKVTHTVKYQRYPDHPERFDLPTPQVLCRQGLSARSYWEVEWNKGWEPDVGVTYKQIRRKGWSDSCLLGRNDHSWCLMCAFSNYSAWHDGSSASFPAPATRRLGVYLDWSAGMLSFYAITPGTVKLVHTFHTMFTEPLYPAFKVGIEGSLTLCQLGKPIWGSQHRHGTP